MTDYEYVMQIENGLINTEWEENGLIHIEWEEYIFFLIHKTIAIKMMMCNINAMI